MGVDIQFSQSYHWLNSWVLANVIQLTTQDFCERFVDYRMDPGRRLYDQMVMAAVWSGQYRGRLGPAFHFVRD